MKKKEEGEGASKKQLGNERKVEVGNWLTKDCIKPTFLTHHKIISYFHTFTYTFVFSLIAAWTINKSSFFFSLSLSHFDWFRSVMAPNNNRTKGSHFPLLAFLLLCLLAPLLFFRASPLHTFHGLIPFPLLISIKSQFFSNWALLTSYNCPRSHIHYSSNALFLFFLFGEFWIFGH